MPTLDCVNRTARDKRKELQRFMRDVKRVNPGASVVLKYDAVEMGGSSYVYHQEEGRVVPAAHQEVEQLETPHSYKVIIVIL